MHFETYRWEDHVPRKGGWKFNLIAGALALGLIAAAFPEEPGDAASPASAAAKPAADVRLSGLETPRRILPAAFVGAAGERTQCPIGHAGS